MSKTINVGRVTAYAEAVAGGYTGTLEEWERDLANLGTTAAEVEANRQAVAEDKAAVEENLTTVESYKNSAAQSASEALQSSETAHTDALASTAAKEAAQSAQTLANEARVDAVSAKGAAESAQTEANTSASSAAEAALVAGNAAQMAAAQAGAASESATAAADSAAAAAESARTLTIDTTLTQEGQAADAKKVGDEVTDLKSATNYGYNLAPVETNGSFNQNGLTTGAANRIRTDLIPFSAGQVIEIDNGTLEHACGIWEGSVSSSNIRRNDNTFSAETEKISTAYNGYLVVVFRKSDNTNLTPLDYDGTVKVYTTVNSNIDNTISGIETDINEANAAFTSFAVDGEYLPIPKSAFARGTVLNGTYNPSVKYRVSTPELVDIIDKTTIYVKSGFKLYLYFYDDGTYTSVTVTTSYEIPTSSKLKIVILRVTEDTTEIANVDYFVSQINTSNKLIDVDQIKNDVYTLKGDISVKSGTNDISACTSQISGDRLIRFASNPTLKGGSKVDSIIYKSNYAKNVDFYIGEITSENNIQIKEVINCPVIVGTNTLINGVDFVSDTVVKNNCVIGYRCEPIVGIYTNGYFGGSEGSFVADSLYITPPIAGDVISTETKTYGIGLSMTLKTFSVPELTIEIGNLADQSIQINVPWEYAIDNVICIGDSLTSGSPADSSTMPYPLEQNYPWYLSRMINTVCTKAGVPGISTKQWYTGEYSKYTMSDYNTFIIFLGTNGGLTNTLATDVDPYDDYHNYADTQTGYYCRIIANILADRPDAFIILVNTWYDGSNQTETRTTIDAIGTKYSLPVVETVGVMPYSVNPIYHGNVDNVHCSKAGYLALADLIRSTIRDYIKAHPAVANKAMSQGT